MKEREPTTTRQEETQAAVPSTLGLEPQSTRDSRLGDPNRGLLTLQRTVGNRAVGRLLRSRPTDGQGSAPSSLRVGRVDDLAEREADSLADEVMERSDPVVRRAGAAAGGDDDCPGCGDRPPSVRRKAAAGRGQTGAPRVVHEALRQAGRPLDAGLRRSMERRFGADLGGVRVHTGDLAAESAAAVDARAYTVGQDVVFAEGEYAPHTGAGQRLLAHELAHVLQQRAQSPAAVAFASNLVQRAPSPGPGEKLQDFQNDYYLLQNAGDTVWTLYFGDSPWIVIKLGKGIKPKLEFHHGDMASTKGVRLGQLVIVTIQSQTSLDVTVDRNVEEAILPTLLGDEARIIYDFIFPGTQSGIDTSGESPPLRFQVREERHPRSIHPEAPREQPPTRTEELRLEDMPDTFQSFDNVPQLRSFLQRNKKRNFVILQMPDGRYLARPLDEDQMQRLAKDARASRYETKGLDYVPWYKGEHARGQFDSVVSQGQELSLDELANLYFPNRRSAGAGAPGEPPEAEVYKMGYKSYGRKPLTHDEALARWRELDKLTRKEIDALETLPGHKFAGLQVRGVSRIHLIDYLYFSAREHFREMVTALDKAKDDDEKKRIDAKTPATAFWDFLMIESDREEDQPWVFEALRKHEDVALLLAGTLYSQVEDWAQNKAIALIEHAADQIASIVESDTQFQRFIFAYHSLTGKAQREALQVLGLPAADVDKTQVVLADKQKAALVALGNPVDGISFAALRKVGQDNLKGVRQVAADLRQTKVKALRVGDEFGVQLRTLTYQHFGFRSLDPKTFPHRDRTPDFFPDVMGGKRSTFSSLGEQLFAYQAKHIDSLDRLEVIFAISMMVVATVALIIVANVAGAAIAGGLFGLAEGTVAFIAVQAIAAGIIITGLEVGAEVALFEKSISGGDVAEKLLWNVGTGFGFGALGKLLKGAGTGLRLGATGAAFLGVSLSHYYIEHKKLPTGDELYWFIYQNALTFALMEGGTVLARPIMQSVGLWARARRLGGNETRINDLIANSSRLSRDLAALYIKPQRAQAEAPRLQAQTEKLLIEQEAVVKELQQRWRTQPDARQIEAEVKVELEQIRAALHSIREAQFLSGLKIKAVGESQALFEYEPQPDTAARFRKFFPEKAKVTELPEGRIELLLPGAREPLVFVPRGTAAPAPAVTPGAPAAKEPVPINHATEEELATLPGIGQKLARAIVEYRQEALKQDRTPFPTVDDLINVPGIGRATLNKVLPYITAKPPAPKASIADIQSALSARQARLLERAERFELSDKSVAAISPAKLRISATTTEKGLKEAGARLEAAEKAIGRRLARSAEGAIKTAQGRFLEDPVTAVAQDRLADVSREEVGAALYWANRYKVGKALRVLELRGLIYAQREGISLAKFFALARGMPQDQVSFTLETFGRMMDARLLGARRVLADMAGSREKWDGGLWAMETARYEFGIENIKGFEITIEGEGARRDYDITLKSGKEIELKNWGAWGKGVDRMGDQFIASVKLNRNDPGAFGKLRILFRHPAPRTAAEIKSYLRGRLDTYLKGEVAAKRLSDKQARAVREAFDAEADLVKVSTTRRFGSVRDPYDPTYTLPVPETEREKEKK